MIKSVLFLLLLTFSSVQPIAWRSGTNGIVKWAYNCDYSSDGDIKHVRSIGEECGKICAQTPGCTRFSHNNYEGGTCWLKSGNSRAFPYQSINPINVCGEVIARPPIAWQSGTNGIEKWAYNCDYSSDGDIKHVRSTGEECGEICVQTPGCTRFSHNNYEGGTCWLKSGNSEVLHSSNNLCGEMIAKPVDTSKNLWRCYIPENTPVYAIAVINSDTIKGHVRFTQSSCSEPVLIEVLLTGLSPGDHGFHVHEEGDTSDGCTSMKGHYNPNNLAHGGPSEEIRHEGDLGNIQANGDGVSRQAFTDSHITLSGPESIIGRGLVIHNDIDDFGKGGKDDSLTTGHAGSRIACAVIGYL